MKGQYQERPKKAKKTPAAADEGGVESKKKKKSNKEQPKTSQNVNSAQQFRSAPMASMPPAAYQQSK